MLNDMLKTLEESELYKSTKKTIIEHKIISIIVLMLILYIINTSKVWTTFDGLITIGTLITVMYNFYNNVKNKKKQSEIIPIFFQLKESGIKYKLKLDIPRREIKRSEIQGLLSNFLVDSTKRYNIDSMSDLEYLSNIYKIQDAKLNELIIIITEEEIKNKKENYAAFDLSKMEIVQWNTQNFQ